jgi:hypothetical protein
MNIEISMDNVISTEGTLEVFCTSYRGYSIREYVVIKSNDASLTVTRLYRGDGDDHSVHGESIAACFNLIDRWLADALGGAV